jgi:hypothetical protein
MAETLQKYRCDQPDLTAAAWHLGWWKLLIGLAFLPANRC